MQPDASFLPEDVMFHRRTLLKGMAILPSASMALESLLVWTDFSAQGAKLPVRWDLAKLFNPPKTHEDSEHGAGDVKAIFYDGLSWKGQPTRVFAYYGLPKNQGTQKVPAMVLVHGGGGSAFIPWVQLWVSRGYAAISMDTCGCVSGGGEMLNLDFLEG